MRLPYEHVQIGWVVLGVSALPIPIVAVAAASVGSNATWLAAAAILLVSVLLFPSLRVTVDESSISLRFGIGLIRRRFSLSDVRSFAEVMNPWYYGWGIRYYPGGTLYNVSGLSAVELWLNDGRRVRVGTDEPAKLFLVLESVLGTPLPMSDVSQAPRGSRRVRLAAISLVVLVLLALPVLLHYQSRAPVVSLTSSSITIDNLFYGQSYRLSDISRVELMPSLPRIRVRTNGYAAGGTLRGWFALDQLGQGKLFVEARQPPYIGIFLKDSFVIVNFGDPVETRRLYDGIRQLLPNKTAAPGW